MGSITKSSSTAKQTIDHLFEFWQHIASKGDFLHKEGQYTYTDPGEGSWPSKVFDIDAAQVDSAELKRKIKTGELPSSLSISADESNEKYLQEQGFELRSVVKGMFLNTRELSKTEDRADAIEQVENTQQAAEFARIGSSAFGYQILASTIVALLNDTRTKLFIGKHAGEFVSCGMLYRDQQGNSGIHMIGTLASSRGLGLGKTMTDKLLFEVQRLSGNHIYLVASEAGERIYSKIGFSVQGSLKSYSVS